MQTQSHVSSKVTFRSAAPRKPRTGPRLGYFDVSWFRGAIEDAETTQTAIAIAMDRDRSALTMLLQGKRKLQIQEAIVLARMLRVSLDDVLIHAGFIEDPAVLRKSKG